MANDFFSRAQMESITKTAQENMKKIMESFTEEMQKVVNANYQLLAKHMSAATITQKREVFDYSVGDEVEFNDATGAFICNVKIINCFFKNYSPIDEFINDKETDIAELVNRKNNSIFKIAIPDVAGQGERYICVSGTQLKKYETNPD
jgi:hypothetical protein